MHPDLYLFGKWRAWCERGYSDPVDTEAEARAIYGALSVERYIAGIGWMLAEVF